MIEKPTVFVIGAGAGVPFGFPTGAQLTKEMAANNVQLPRGTRIGRGSGWRDELRGRTNELAEAIRYAQPKSIDDFLRVRDGFAGIGKLLIAGHLAQFEIPDALFDYTAPEHWLRNLWHQMQAPPDEFLVRNKASFIVFNYDRCVEHYLTTVMATTFSVSPGQAWNAIQGFIVHPHGNLGNYIPLDIDGSVRDFSEQLRDGARSFVPATTVDEADVAAKCIRFFWEDAPEALVRRELIDRLLLEAQYVVFLGFGYIESNLELFRELFNRAGTVNLPHIIGSCYGMGTQERRRVELRFNNIGITLGDLQPDTFLRENVPLHELAAS